MPLTPHRVLAAIARRDRARAVKPAALRLSPPGRLAGGAGLAGGRRQAGRPAAQSLGPMLNLRLCGRRSAWSTCRHRRTAPASERATTVRIGAALTHAAIEDGAVPDAGWRLPRRRGAAHRLPRVRNRGTLGGSLAHADPRPIGSRCLIAFRASRSSPAREGERRIPLARIRLGAFETALATTRSAPRCDVRCCRPPRALGPLEILPQAGRILESHRRVLPDPAPAPAARVLGGHRRRAAGPRRCHPRCWRRRQGRGRAFVAQRLSPDDPLRARPGPRRAAQVRRQHAT